MRAVLRHASGVVEPEFALFVALLCGFAHNTTFSRRGRRAPASEWLKELENMKSISSRLGVGISVLALAACVSSLALAETPSAAGDARPQCSGEHGKNQAEGDRAQHAAERFKKDDKNGDGFLTQAEVGDKRWAHISVADANKDGKISMAELAQAHADGKLGHKHDGKPPA
jgi:hypothetical protein